MEIYIVYFCSLPSSPFTVLTLTEASAGNVNSSRPKAALLCW